MKIGITERGADSLAKRYAQEYGYQYHEFPADWHTYGKSAGYVRNREIHNFELCKSYNNPLRIYKYQA